MTLPRKRKPQKSGILRAAKREWPRHRKWLRSHECVCTLSAWWVSIWGCEGVIDVSHIRTAANAGKGLKPHDSSAVPMCRKHHIEYHGGDKTFEKKYGLDLAKLAAEFTAKSPDIAMRESLSDNGAA